MRIRELFEAISTIDNIDDKYVKRTQLARALKKLKLSNSNIVKSSELYKNVKQYSKKSIPTIF